MEPDPDTYNIDHTLVEDVISSNTKAIIAVYLYGQPADMDPLITIAKHHNLKFIEDAAQAHGAEYKRRKTGSLAHASAFSFYPSKNLGAFGDTGAIVTADSYLIDQINRL